MPFALMMAAAVSAEPITLQTADYAQRYTRAEWLAAYPQAAMAERESGNASLLCHVAKTGWLVDCTVESEEPSGRGFGEASIKIAHRNRLKPEVASKYGQEAWLRYQGRFNQASLAGPDDPSVRPPEWIRRPSASELNAAWPSEALRKGISGTAIIDCRVNLTGALEDCRVAEEKPDKLGFGVAAILLAPTVRMKPAMQDNKPIVSRGRFPIAFKNEVGSDRGERRAPVKILTAPPYDRTPSYTDIIDAWPATVRKDEVGGKAALRCRLRETGLLEDCDFSFVSSPSFERPSRELIKKFHIKADGATRQDLEGVYVALSIQFIKPENAVTGRAVTHAVWTDIPDEARTAKLYPAEAMKQGVKVGTGRTRCTVAPAGGLVDCKVVSESPENMGFATAVVATASMMRMTLWGEDGLPTGGATVTLPMQIHQPEPELATK